MFDLIRRPSSNLGLSTFEEMDKLFDNMLRSFNLPVGLNMPSVDIYSEDEKHMIVELPAPGFKDEDIDIQIRDNLLEVRGERKNDTEQRDSKRSYMVRESTASFARRVVLPEGADAENIEAELRDGLLKISVPVTRPAAKRITIKTNGKKQLKS